MVAEADYVWGTGITEQQRLLKQIELYVPEATWLLDRLELAPGSHAIDLGCGPLGMLDLLSKRVGARGKVIGIEWEPRFVDMAKTLLRERGIVNVSVSAGDAAATGLPDASFRFVHERLLLIVVAEPEKIVAEMARLAEPGGVVALEDVDVGSWICEPPHPAWERLFTAVETVYARDGKDLQIGRRLPGLLRAAGLVNVGCKPHARVNGPGDFHQQQLLVFVKLFWRRIVELGLIAEPELESLSIDLESHLAQPGTMVVSPTLFQAWGEKPAHDLERVGPVLAQSGHP